MWTMKAHFSLFPPKVPASRSAHSQFEYQQNGPSLQPEKLTLAKTASLH